MFVVNLCQRSDNLFISLLFTPSCPMGLFSGVTQCIVNTFSKYKRGLLDSLVIQGYETLGLTCLKT